MNQGWETTAEDIIVAAARMGKEIDYETASDIMDELDLDYIANEALSADCSDDDDDSMQEQVDAMLDAIIEELPTSPIFMAL